MRLLGEDATGADWALTAYLAVLGTACLLMAVGQMVRAPGPVQTVERDLGSITAPTDPLPCTDDDTLKLSAARNEAITCPGDDR